MEQNRGQDGADPTTARDWVKGIVFVAVAIVLFFALFWIANGPRAT
jgi:hypothetical protein